MGFVKKSNASAFLFFNAFLWGSSYVWSKMLLGYLPRFSILFLCSLGGLISTCIIFYPTIKTIKAASILPCMAVSMLSIISNTFFMFALQYTSSSNTAFIVQLSVIITPCLMALIEKKAPERKIIAGAFIAVAGLFMLTCDIDNFRLNTGDLLALGNALFFSAFLTGLNLVSKKVGPVQFSFIHHLTNTAGFLAIAGIFEARLIVLDRLASPVFLMLISASIFIAAFTVLFQSAAIKFVRPDRATLIYTFEPVTALILGFAFIGEKLSGVLPVIGCILILSSVIYSMYVPKSKVKGPRYNFGRMLRRRLGKSLTSLPNLSSRISE